MSKRRKIAHFGAFDHDSYGDLIFPIIAEYFLPEFDLVHVSPSGRDTPWRDARASISLLSALSIDDWDGVIVGGGDLIQVTNWAPTNWRVDSIIGVAPIESIWIAGSLLAARLDIPLVWNAPGVPRVLDRSDTDLSHVAVQAPDYLAVRDHTSKQHLSTLRHSAIEVVPDTALSLATIWPTPANLRGQNYVTLSFTSFDYKQRLPQIAYFLTRLRDFVGESCQFRVLPLMAWQGDDHYAKELLSNIDKNICFVPRNTTLKECALEISSSRGYIGNSLHGLITSVSYGVPGVLVKPMGSERSIKYAGFLTSIGANVSDHVVNDWEEAAARLNFLGAKQLTLPSLDEHWHRVRRTLSNGSNQKKIYWHEAVQQGKSQSEQIVLRGLLPDRVDDARFLEWDKKVDVYQHLVQTANDLADGHINRTRKFSAQSTEAVVYLGRDTQSAFSETDTLREQVWLDGSVRTLCFRLNVDFKIASVRFDPACVPCTLLLHRLELVRNGSEGLWKALSAKDALSSASEIYVASEGPPWQLDCVGNDPAMSLNLDQNTINALDDAVLLYVTIQYFPRIAAPEHQLAIPNVGGQATTQAHTMEHASDIQKKVEGGLLAISRLSRLLAENSLNIVRTSNENTSRLRRDLQTSASGVQAMLQERSGAIENAIRETSEGHAQLLQDNLGLTSELLSAVTTVAKRMDDIDGFRRVVAQNENLRSTLEQQSIASRSLESEHEQSLRALSALRGEIERVHQLEQRLGMRVERAITSVNEILGLESRATEEVDELNDSFEVMEQKFGQLKLLVDQLNYDLAREKRTSSALSAQSDAVFNSFSWRLTRPLRRAFDLIKSFGETEKKNAREIAIPRNPQRASSARRPGDQSFACAPSNHGGVIIVSHDAHFAGAPMLALNLTRVLKEELEVEVVVFLLGPGALQPRFEALCDVYTFGRDAEAIKRLTQVALTLKRERGFDIAFCNTVVTGKVCQALERVDIPAIALVHELGASIEKMQLHEEAEALASSAKRIVFPGHLVREEFSRYGSVSSDRVLLMHQGVFSTNPYQGKRASAKKQFEKLYGHIGNSLLIVGAGYGDMRKGIDVFVRVARSMCLTLDNLIFTWIGDVEPNCARSLSLRFDRHGSGTLRFVGLEPITSNYLAAVAAADIFFLSSREDPFPSVVLDALHAGTPVLAFRNVGSFEDILDGSNSVLANFLDESSITSSIRKFLESPGLLQSLQESTLTQAAKLPTMAEYGHNLLGLAEQLKRPIASS